MLGKNMVMINEDISITSHDNYSIINNSIILRDDKGDIIMCNECGGRTNNVDDFCYKCGVDLCFRCSDIHKYSCKKGDDK